MNHRKSKGIPEKTSTSASLTTLKPCTVCITTKILKEMGIPNHFTCLLRNLYAGQEATVRTRHGTTGWFQTGKGVHQGCILSSCLFNLYAEYIMQNAWLDEAQTGIKIAGRNINNFRYADDTTLMAENEEELKSLLMKVKGKSEKAGLKFNIQQEKKSQNGSYSTKTTMQRCHQGPRILQSFHSTSLSMHLFYSCFQNGVTPQGMRVLY